MHPQRTIERCADAMSETLKTARERIEPTLLKTLSPLSQGRPQGPADGAVY
jgi:hypothetical protein